MKRKLYLIGAASAACVLAISTAVARQPAHPPRAGTDILHWFVRADLANQDTNSAASAAVDLKQNQQGRANNQRIDLRVQALETNAPYQLWALVGDDTNYVHAADFTTDAKGNAKLKFMKIGSSHGHGYGKGQYPVPGDLDPISQIRGVAIGNVNTQAVLTASLLTPDKLQYLIKRRLTGTNVVADLRLKATTSQLQFRFYVWGLAPTNEYHLTLNDTVVVSGSSSTNGNLSFDSLPVNAAEILSVHSLSLVDAATNTVLHTTLP